MTTSKILEGLLEEEQLAADLNKSPRTIARWRAEPDGLPFIPFGGQYLYDPESVRSWLLSRQQQRNPRRHGKAA